MQSDSMAQQTVEIPLRLKDRLQITIKETREEIPTTYASRVENISGGDIVIRWPNSRGAFAPLQNSDILCIFFIKGSDVFAIDARILKLMPNPNSLVVVRCEGQIRKIQRRDYVRVPAMIDVRLTTHLVKAGATDKERIAYIITTTTVDISGGGFSIHWDTPLQMGSLYDVKMKIPTLEQPLLLMAKVVRMEPALNRLNKTYYDIGFDFTLLDEKVRRQIIKYVFRFEQNSLARRT
jgi:c-di-GMP-binding flagellar brake protein YcgR